ncbi:MAG: HAMP domain-containing sensor histidine kinase [Bacillota bacterium]|nr:HAMP domain-containing sensor histidine kinase [Bacillota bacterium]
MFRSLRLKLTLTNTAVTGLIFLLLLTGVYIVMQQGFQRQSERIMNSIASDEGLGYSPYITRPHRPLDPNYFFVRVDSVGNIIDNSPNLTNTSEEIYALVDKTMQVEKDMGYISIDGVSFRFLKSYSNFRKDLLKIVFYNTQPESQMLTRLLVTIITIGLVTVLTTFLASLFMANRALIPVKKSWERQKAFVADASHELRTPLAVVQTNLELVMGNKEDTIESQLYWLDNIKAENIRMSKLVSDLLFLARSDSHEVSAPMNEFPLDVVIKETLSSFKLICESKNIELKDNVYTETNYYGNEGRIKQLITILLDNAVKYTAPYGKIAVGLIKSEDNIEIKVSDTGEGIPKEHLEKIFERFYRVDTSRASKSGGTGLGLSIADAIIKEHNGRINVTSDVGKGSEFLVTLPNKRKYH